ncbi:hypothetical protein [Pararhizobium antarcticum]|nr:hypothetical protein [Pararhizobium antarcticum]
MRKLGRRLVLAALFFTIAAVVVWGWQLNDHISRCFDDYDPAYIADETARNAACEN